jgi:hypothetical protein
MVSITYGNFKKVDLEKLETVCKKHGAKVDHKTKRIFYEPSKVNGKEFYSELDECASNGGFYGD